ncbi:MAG TPA: succinyl-diaminopimelate desuccinylase [Alphaproteobacteria bacterium]|jgi:succinyl-diaminopimelate desuccinylase|nr:MAG: succinyl-diaminopimelate desuccinylase [SAR116 cluster bacterium MED-G05]HAO56784.1 succinyl-diaminopimelate desuccinylase [Alphaproteobacteria bacterium]HBD51698.1 succinyl-diaminopimelate desuccinylase [Alphaproteobacteria bacterium]HBP72810.1 succinyl-diaminopimelate desuccinylase [Alphaproteobacteria bacterium]HCA91227.1 succinyl-diaminopimelate desuccinylase [Alphaproteobacteria bacterium]|tara:strand:- start:17838 stop:18989 length:1152 start_codon:yes stop_codon:yes gene_type:complete
MNAKAHAVDLAQRLIRCPSVTPAEGGAINLLEAELSAIGFACTRLPFGEGNDRIDNLFARYGSAAPHVCFAGHTDVVPVGDAAAWTRDPFGGDIVGGVLFGRGAADMKGGVAAFVAAAAAVIEGGIGGSVSLLITGDEEGDAVNGTVRMVEWAMANDQIPDMCVVGEPTNPDALGDMIKNGRRGSLSGHLVVTGRQGHVAYPHLADNPLTRLVAMLAPVNGTELDGGTPHFLPSAANVTTIDVGNPATNVIPARAEAKFNIRFNTEHSADSLRGWLEEHFTRVGGDWHAQWKANADPFITDPGPLTDMLAAAVTEITGRTPALSTTGGTSDARFITRMCPVAEFGLVGKTMHQVDEHVDVADIEELCAIYQSFLVRACGEVVG